MLKEIGKALAKELALIGAHRLKTLARDLEKRLETPQPKVSDTNGAKVYDIKTGQRIA